MKNNILINFLSEGGERFQRWFKGDGEWKELDKAVQESFSEFFFSTYMQRHVLAAAASEFIDRKALLNWFDTYNISYDLSLPDEHSLQWGIVAADNIPAVALHDVLAVYVSGLMSVIKFSSKGHYLITAIFPEAEYVSDVEELHGLVEALLTMRSDYAASSLRKRFKKVPKVVRGSRYSITVLSGEELDDDLEKLAEDILLYYIMDWGAEMFRFYWCRRSMIFPNFPYI